jgi:hypothetical protein
MTNAAYNRSALSNTVRAFDDATGTRRGALRMYANEARWTLSNVAFADLDSKRVTALATACRRALSDADRYYPAN